MKYYKINVDNIISVATINTDGDGNITEEEYGIISALLEVCPDGKVLTERNGGYEYMDAPITQDDIPAEEALDIILGGEI